MAEAPRSMCVRQVGGQETVERNLFTVVLADRTFPVAMHLWSDQRVGHVHMLSELYERLTAGQTLLVRFEDVLVKRVAQESLVPMKRLVSTDSTQIFAWTVREQTYLALTKAAPAENALALKIIGALAARGPCTFSVVGVVAGAGELGAS